MKEALLKQLFAPVKARYRLLLVFPVCNLLLLAIVVLFLKAPKEAILVSMGAISFIVFLTGTKKFASLFYLSSLLFNALIFFTTWSVESFWSRGWGLSMMITLTIGYFLSHEVLDFYRKEEKDFKDSEVEKGLWKNRFETLRDAHNLEIGGLEDDLIKTKEGLDEKNNQIAALEKLVEVTHKEAAILSKQKHELLDKLACENDPRNEEEIKRQNLSLEKQLHELRFLERDVQALKEEKETFISKISALQEHNRLLQQEDSLSKIEALQQEIITLREEKEAIAPEKGYSKEQIYKMIEDLSVYSVDKTQLDAVLLELREKFQDKDKPFKWQVWKGEKKEKKAFEKKGKISMLDLGKGLKI